MTFLADGERGARIVNEASVGLMRLTPERRYRATPDQLAYDSMLRQRDYWERRALEAEAALYMKGRHD